MIHHSTVVVIPGLHSGTLLQQETTGSSDLMVLTRKGMDLADKTYKVKRHRIVWLLAHPVRAHGEGVGFVSSGRKGRL